MFYRTHGEEERAVLLRFILQGSTLQDGKIIPVFKPPFDIIHGLAKDVREAERRPSSSRDIKKQAASGEAACPLKLPRTDSNCRPAG